MNRPVKTLLMLTMVPVMLLCHNTQLAACSLNPTANITNSPSGSIFHAHTETEIELSGSTSVANCGTITEYRWRIDGVTKSTSMVYNHIFTILPSQDQKSYSVELRVRNSAGNYHTRTKTILIRRVKSLYYLTDHLGSVRVTVNEAGDPVGWDDYYPFGLQMPGRTQNASNPNDDTKFTGYELEQQGELGLYHAGARMYDPEIARFTTQDPALRDYSPNKQLELISGGLLSNNPYNYVLNNPAKYVDPDGRIPIAPALYGAFKLSAYIYAVIKASLVTATVGTVAYTGYRVYDEHGESLSEMFQHSNEVGISILSASPYVNQTLEQLGESLESFEDLLIEHKKTVEDYIQNPDAHDNQGRLANARNEQERESIIRGRIRALEKQMEKHKGEIEKIRRELELRKSKSQRDDQERQIRNRN